MLIMVRDKIWQANVLLSNLQKIENLISLFEKHAKCSNETVCRSFLQNAADKKNLQLIVLERIVRNRGIEVAPTLKPGEKENSYYVNNVSVDTLEEIFNLLSRQSLRDLKLYSMLALENGNYKPIFKAMEQLEEDYLIFIETDYINHLNHAATRDSKIGEYKKMKPEYANSVA